MVVTPEPQKQRLHFASAAFGDETLWGVREEIFLCLQNLRNFRYKNYIGSIDSQEAFLKLSDQVRHVLCFREPLIGQRDRIDSQQAATSAIHFTADVGTRQKEPMRFRNVCVAVES